MSNRQWSIKRLQQTAAELCPPGWLPIIASVAIFVVVWQLAASVVPAYVFPNLFELGAAFEQAFGPDPQFNVLDHYPITIARVLLAAVLCLVVGVVMGIVMGTSKTAQEYLMVYVLATFAFPSVIWAFFAILWMGLSVWFVTVFPVFMVVMPYVTINVYEGMTDLDGRLPEMADSFGASRFLVWQNIYIPHLLPHLFANARLALMLSWKITLVGEIFGTTSGVGLIINNYFQANQNEMIIAWVIPMMVLVFLADRLLTRLEHRLFAWRATPDKTTAATA